MDKNKTQLFIGLILIVAAFFCVFVIIYFIGNDEKAQLTKISSLEADLANLVNEKAADQMASGDYERAKQAPIDIEEFIAKAKNYYSPQELSRKEGILWVDRKTLKGMITLGAIHGLVAGSYLDVYDGSQGVGSVRVEEALDIISYVASGEKPFDQFPKNYYRVVIRQ